MKKFISCIILLIILLSVCGCTVDAPDITTEPIAPTEIELEVPYDATPVECYIMKDYLDNDCVVFVIDWVNYTTEDVSYLSAIYTTAYQDGIQLETTAINPLNNLFTQYGTNNTVAIKNGASIEVLECFILWDTTSPVTIEISQLFNSDNMLLYTTDYVF